jgi:hypothetical protein
MTQPMIDLIWTSVGFFLTLMVFSYVLGDNPLFRVASYLLVGSAAGYLFTLVIYQVIIQRLVFPLMYALPTGNILQILLTTLPVVASLMLLFKLFSGNLSAVGSLPLAYTLGVGAAVMITGTATGTILGQAQATINLFSSNNLLEASVVLVGVITTLAYFHYGTRATPTSQGARRNPFVEALAFVGKLFIGVTLGALFAGVYLAALSALVTRLDYLRFVIENVFFKIGSS